MRKNFSLPLVITVSALAISLMACDSKPAEQPQAEPANRTRPPESSWEDEIPGYINPEQEREIAAEALQNELEKLLDEESRLKLELDEMTSVLKELEDAGNDAERQETYKKLIEKAEAKIKDMRNTIELRKSQLSDLDKNEDETEVPENRYDPSEPEESETEVFE